MSLDTYEIDQPWVLYHYGATHDAWWPFWNSTHVLGYARIDCECMVCGDRTAMRLRIPRFRAVPDKGHHPKRVQYLEAHAHPDRGHPMSWVLPLTNLAAHPGGLNIAMLAMRLNADLLANEEDS